eukprot:TRINITY_DN168_c0_g2_i1.p1 TRINITY_DN168_c0_g2~~TRINITY_DN168_c0_g2_i1.p1  ORF type:complete len:200 (-),score=40.08 TRINITY_DN168_c0_g2_i1:172-771(-)
MAQVFSDEYGNQYYDTQAYTPDFMNSLQTACDGYLLPLSGNTYSIQFTNFRIRCLDPGNECTIFDIQGGSQPSPPPEGIAGTANANRFIRYRFGSGLLDCQTIGTTLEFVNGPQEVRNFRMIERHYFRDQLVTSYDFTMPFVIPNTTNNWEMIYENPLAANEDWKAALRTAPWEWKSDSFYFVDDVLIMHNRAEYDVSE